MTRSGLIFDERYRLEKRIAAGGVGQVWQATDLLLERPVAIKVLRPEYADHPETLDRFRKEARHAGALSHPNIAQVYDYAPGGPDGSPYLVMEFVDGPSLADLLAVDPIGPALALDIIAQAADGLSAAHQAGLVHRDIKPGNLLISSNGRVKVTDFGIAYAAGQAPVTAPGLVMGTTQYMAPERIAGTPGTPASDLYALGIVLHECLTGIPPHEGTPAEVMAAHLYLPLPPLPADAPPELDVLVTRLTVKDPAARISDARELAALAGELRDKLGNGHLVPPARTAILSEPVPAAALAAAGFDSAGRNSPASPAVAMAAGGDGDQAAADWADAGAAAVGLTGTAGQSDEWAVPPRMSLPSSVQTGPAERAKRRRAGAIAAGSALAAGAGLAALLLSGAFSTAPSANPAPAVPSTRVQTRTVTATPTGRASAVSGPVGTSGATGQRGGRGSTATPTATGSNSLGGTSPAPSGSATSSPSATSGTPTSAPSSQSPSPSPSGSCTPVLGLPLPCMSLPLDGLLRDPVIR